ncbi:MAG: hypothetical protein DMG04_23290 [Acidobacteria bacterium]|nr:MAG: hypothetical protein DMG04_23290 [Acidobacteriota bacterium]PYQ81337.1 MAG: hypothetical protein DMG01_04240 [Acidobacteriota bacterium]PYQ84642.1 MAG: hypothetical protein DMG02_30670 [Acidobacteriota bacterium]PYQ89006.1 MAG: hypothetical protein DMG03_02495 [Acidobacteriota bacterium]PYR06269.1 MAG: hypothetical protein DMF99_26415 [Acidobacteriota bacterium]
MLTGCPFRRGGAIVVSGPGGGAGAVAGVGVRGPAGAVRGPAGGVPGGWASAGATASDAMTIVSANERAVMVGLLRRAA